MMDSVLELTDKQLAAELRERGENPGPILPSTRKLYEKKLQKMKKDEVSASTVAASTSRRSRTFRDEATDVDIETEKTGDSMCRDKNFDLLNNKAEDTRLVKHGNTVYKLKMLFVDCGLASASCPLEVATYELEQAFRAVLYMEQRDVELKPIKTQHFVVFPRKKFWKISKKLVFTQNEKILSNHPFYFQFSVKQKEKCAETELLMENAELSMENVSNKEPENQENELFHAEGVQEMMEIDTCNSNANFERNLKPKHKHSSVKSSQHENLGEDESFGLKIPKIVLEPCDRDLQGHQSRRTNPDSEINKSPQKANIEEYSHNENLTSKSGLHENSGVNDLDDDRNFMPEKNVLHSFPDEIPLRSSPRKSNDGCKFYDNAGRKRSLRKHQKKVNYNADSENDATLMLDDENEENEEVRKKESSRSIRKTASACQSSGITCSHGDSSRKRQLRKSVKPVKYVTDSGSDSDDHGSKRSDETEIYCEEAKTNQAAEPERGSHKEQINSDEDFSESVHSRSADSDSEEWQPEMKKSKKNKQLLSSSTDSERDIDKERHSSCVDNAKNRKKVKMAEENDRQNDRRGRRKNMQAKRMDSPTHVDNILGKSYRETRNRQTTDRLNASTPGRRKLRRLYNPVDVPVSELPSADNCALNQTMPERGLEGGGKSHVKRRRQTTAAVNLGKELREESDDEREKNDVESEKSSVNVDSEKSDSNGSEKFGNHMQSPNVKAGVTSEVCVLLHDICSPRNKNDAARNSETGRLEKMSKITHRNERSVSDYKAKDRHMVEREEKEEEAKLQELAKTNSPPKTRSQSLTSPRKRRTPRTNAGKGLLDTLDDYIITPVKKLFRSGSAN